MLAGYGAFFEGDLFEKINNHVMFVIFIRNDVRERKNSQKKLRISKA